MSPTAFLVTFITNAIAAGGYPALLLLTTLDSTVLPVPNEAIMPFAGFLISGGRFGFGEVVGVSVIGGVAGSLTSYAIGYYGAERFVERFGKYVRLSPDDLKKTHVFFEKYGHKVILVSRFIPLVRQFISIPAGAGKMHLGKFVLYTAVGAALWNSAITYVGYVLGNNWQTIGRYTKVFDVLILASAVIAGYAVYRKLKKRQKPDFNTHP